MSFADTSTLIANIALTLTFIVGLIFGIAQVKAVERDRRERLTIGTLEAFQTREFAELIQFVAADHFPKTEAEYLKLPLNEKVMYIQFSQQMESLGILVAENLIDIDLVDKTLGAFVTSSFEKYKVVFTGIRKNDPFIGEYFQWLAEKIEHRMNNFSRKPYYEMPADNSTS